MRKVEYKIWIPAVKVQLYGEFSPWITKEGTGKWEDRYNNKGVFHQWASAYEEFESGAGNYTVALVETPSGEIVEVLPSKLRFI